MINVRTIDHVVLNVADPEKSAAWYQEKLGLQPERLDEWRAGTIFFPSVRVSPTFIIDLLPIPRTGENMNHLCLVVDPVDLDAVADSGDFDVVDGPTEPRFGAQGLARSLYVRDPDGNTVELRAY